MPSNGGTAVHIMYSIAQLVGAKYGAHEKDLSVAAGNMLRVPGQPIRVIPVNAFLNYAKDAQQMRRSNNAADNTPQKGPASYVKFCGQCGQARNQGAKFCTKCGLKFK